MFSYLLGNVNGLVVQMSAENNLKRKQAEELEEWLLKVDRVGKTKRIHNDDIDFITRYMSSYWHNNVQNMDQGEFISQLDAPLRRSLFNKYIFLRIKDVFHHFFDGLDAEFARKLILKMEYSKYSTQGRQTTECTQFIKAGKVPSFVYFVLSGHLGLYSFDGILQYLTLKAGSIFGEVYVLFHIPCTYTLKYDPFHLDVSSAAEKVTELYRVSAEDYLNILKDYEPVYLRLKSEATTKRRVYRKLKCKCIERSLADAPDQPRASLAPSSVLERTPLMGPCPFPPAAPTEEDKQRLLTDRNILSERTVVEAGLPAASTPRQELDWTKQKPEEAPGGFTNVLGLMGERSHDLRKKTDSQRNSVQPPVRVVARSRIMSEMVKGENRRALNHREMMVMENAYNSEDEYGQEDYYDKHRAIADPKATYRKIKSIRVFQHYKTNDAI